MRLQTVALFVLSLVLITFTLPSCANLGGKTKIIKIYTVKEGEERNQIEDESLLSAESISEESPNVKNVTRITDLQGRKSIWYPCVSEDGSFVVFSLYNKKKDYLNLWKKNIRGGGMTRLTYGRFWDIYPTVSPDGKYIYFSSNRAGNFSIWRIDISGGRGITRITTSTLDAFAPQISSDGMKLIFHAYVPGERVPQIWTCLIDGTELTQIRAGYQPIWSKDDKKILFLAGNIDEPSKKDIWIMNADGTNVTQLTQNSDIRNCNWGPNGEIVYSKLNEDAVKENTDIYIGNTQLTTNLSYDDFPQFDKKNRLYFISTRGFSADLWYTTPMLP